MTLKSLQDWVEEEKEQQQEMSANEDPKLRELIEKSRNLPFYKWGGFGVSILQKSNMTIPHL